MTGLFRTKYRNEISGRDAPPFWRVLPWLLTRRRPKPTVTSLRRHPYPFFPCAHDDLRLFLVGHCTLILEVQGQYLLTDPVFSEFASPLPNFGPRRFNPPGTRLEWLPRIDGVLITHNHYDHLDERTILALPENTLYIVPQGLAPWFQRRGRWNVRELPWWESTEVGIFKVTATPSLHWSKRTPFDRNTSHWNGYAVQAAGLRVLFIGDSGYYDGFRRIGERLGPFHVAALPIGAYQPRSIMANVHMTPEEAVRACEDVQATIMLPIHHGCFPLTDEEVLEPPQRAAVAWEAMGRNPDHLWLLNPGQFRSLEDLVYIPVSSAQVRKQLVWAEQPLRQTEITEWSIARCEHHEGMVDLQAVGERVSYWTGDGGSTLSLNHMECSGFGSVPQCTTSACPLRDPGFLRSHDLHGHRDPHGIVEPFVEMDSPPDPRWWRNRLRITQLQE